MSRSQSECLDAIEAAGYGWRLEMLPEDAWPPHFARVQALRDGSVRYEASRATEGIGRAAAGDAALDDVATWCEAHPASEQTDG